jgi:hypothetical protein
MGRFNIDNEPVLAKKVGVTFAAAALRIFEKDDLGWIGMGQRCNSEVWYNCCQITKSRRANENFMADRPCGAMESIAKLIGAVASFNGDRFAWNTGGAQFGSRSLAWLRTTTSRHTWRAPLTRGEIWSGILLSNQSAK